MRNFRPCRSATRLDLLAEPAAHLAAGAARRQRDAAVLLEQRRHRFGAAAEEPPRVVLAHVAAEPDRGAEREGRILAEVVVGRRVAHLHGAGLDGIEHLQRGHDLARGKDADLELAVGDLADALGDQLGGAVDGVQALGPARSHPPLDGRLRLGDGRRGDGAGRHTDSRLLEKRSALHGSVPPVMDACCRTLPRRVACAAWTDARPRAAPPDRSRTAAPAPHHCGGYSSRQWQQRLPRRPATCEVDPHGAVPKRGPIAQR